MSHRSQTLPPRRERSATPVSPGSARTPIFFLKSGISESTRRVLQKILGRDKQVNAQRSQKPFFFNSNQVVVA